MWRLCKLGYSHEPGLLLAAFTLALLSALPDALLALWFKLLGDGVLQSDWSLVRIAAVALGVSATATWFLRTVSTRVQRRFRDKVTIALESHVARLLASIATIAHQERPEYLDRLAVLRNQVFMLDHMYMSLFSTCGWILRLGVTVALLMSIHPALALLAVFAVPTVVTSTWRPGVERSAYERGAQANRLARHLFDVATTATPGKEVRVTGIGDRLIAERRLAWEFWHRPIARARWRSAAWHTLAWSVFGAAYAGAIVFVSSGLHAPGRRRSARARGWGAAVGLHRRRRWERLASCAASGWTARDVWPGSKTTPHRWSSDADQPVPARLVGRHPLRARVVCLSRHRAAGARRRHVSMCRQARWSRLLARTGRGRPRW